MFKEALAGALFLLLFLICYRIFWKKQRRAALLTAAALLMLFCVANLLYNALVMFPDYYMDTATGVYRYGTFSGNLFAYSEEFRHQDTILFPILKNRSVVLDDSAGFYEKFFTLYSKDCQKEAVSETDRECILSHQEDFSFSHAFTCIGIMDYVTEEIPEQLSDDFEEKNYPQLYIHIDSLKGQSRLRAVMAKDYTLYLMSDAYYKELISKAADTCSKEPIGGTKNV